MNLKQILRGTLTEKELAKLVRSFDIIGDIAIIRIPLELEEKQALIGEAVLQMNKHVRIVARRDGSYQGEFRTQPLHIIAGEQRKETEYKEWGVRFVLNPEEVYFSVRLSNERKRVTKLIQACEDVLVLFSGIGAYPLIIGRNSSARRVVGIEKNRAAHDFALRSLGLNRRVTNVTLLHGDVMEAAPKLPGRFDRVVMPFPQGANDFLGEALDRLRPNGMLHFYAFAPKEEVDDVVELVNRGCKEQGRKLTRSWMHICGHVGTRKYRICVDARIE